MRAGAEPYPGTPDRHRASASSHNDRRAPQNQPTPSAHPPPCEQILTQWPPLTSKSANPASPPATVRTNPHTTTVKPHRTGKTRPPKRHRASQSSQTGVRNDHREISACPHIRNTTQRPSNHRRPRQFIPIRMPRHTQPDRTHHQQSQQHIQPPGNACPGIHNPTHRTKPRPSATNHHRPYPPAYANTTHHPSSPCRPAICERILTQWPPHTGKSANPNNSNRRYVSRASHRHRRTPPKPPPTAIRTAIV